MDRVIHYCWFGGAPLTQTAEDAIASWKKYAPGFRIKRWDESNTDLDLCPFLREAYEARRWAFVSDFIRFWTLYEFGGIYMDIGSILIKEIEPLLELAPFTAQEFQTRTANPGLIACCERRDPIVGEILDIYRCLPFEDDNEFFDKHTVNEITTGVLEKNGFKRELKSQFVAGWHVLPYESFNPVYGFGGYHIKDGTYSIHKGSASWQRPMERAKQEFVRSYAPYIGKRPAEILGRTLWEIKRLGGRMS